MCGICYYRQIAFIRFIAFGIRAKGSAFIHSKGVFPLRPSQSRKIKSSDRCTMKYRSVIGFGHASFIEALEDKRNALDLIMRHYNQEPIPYPEPVLTNMLAVIKVEIEEMTGKAST